MLPATTPPSQARPIDLRRHALAAGAKPVVGSGLTGIGRDTKDWMTAPLT